MASRGRRWLRWVIAVVVAVAVLAVAGPYVFFHFVEGSTPAPLRLTAGATLLQAYTAFIYEGPCWPGRVQRGLAARIRAAQPV